MSRGLWKRKNEGKKKWLCTLCRIRFESTVHCLIGIDPRHSLYRLSLLPSGPDEVHDRLLRGDRSKLSAFSN